MSNDISTRALSAIQKLIDQQLQAEVIDGTSLADVIDAVDLDIAFTPVVQFSAGYEHTVPRVSHVEKWANGYAIVDHKAHDFERVTDGTLKVMRARFLLLKNHYYRRLRNMGHSMRCEVLSQFFPEGAWVPEEGSELSKLMGLES